MRRLMFIGCGLLLATVSASAAEPTGVWLVENGSAQIRIENCGGALWGVVNWEKVAGHDTENPDPALRGRPTLGMPILLDMKPGKSDRWDGQIYNPENGKMYTSNIRLSAPNTLRVEGCVLGFLCGGQDWSRVTDAAQAAALPKGPAPKAGAKGPPARNALAAANNEVCSRVSISPGAAH